MKSTLQKSNSTDSGTGVFLPAEPGTGVFLPKIQASADNLEGMNAENTCSESDGDSNDSTSDCLMVEEKRLFKRGNCKHPLKTQSFI